jgi:hypothetical protein
MSFSETRQCWSCPADTGRIATSRRETEKQTEKEVIILPLVGAEGRGYREAVSRKGKIKCRGYFNVLI